MALKVKQLRGVLLDEAGGDVAGQEVGVPVCVCVCARVCARACACARMFVSVRNCVHAHVRACQQPLRYTQPTY